MRLAWGSQAMVQDPAAAQATKAVAVAKELLHAVKRAAEDAGVNGHGQASRGALNKIEAKIDGLCMLNETSRKKVYNGLKEKIPNAMKDVQGNTIDATAFANDISVAKFCGLIGMDVVLPEVIGESKTVRTSLLQLVLACV
jgi:hypothetical protein